MVQLKSGGPEMTVKGYAVHHEAFQCQRFAGKKLEQGYFVEESLIKAGPKA
ncbi:DUF2158 domain-containing protein [Pantoea eucalypti]|nr:DUF2158 domain-containing protein [Pantoea eucalypti]MDJ0474326.1 DUF2158 domain-containing protein [Pantoea eucalypti]